MITAQLAALRTLIDDRWPGSRTAGRAEQLAATLPRALAHMADHCPDGYPTSTPGAPDRGNGGRSTAELTSVEAAVHHRTRPADAYAALCASVANAAAHVALMDRRGTSAALRQAQQVVDAWQPLAPDTYRSLRCTPPSDEAMQPWARPDCENIAAPGRRGLCDACSMRRHRWQREQACA